MILFNWHKKIKISYGITVCNEAVELKALLNTLIPLIGKKDEIIILQDITNKDIPTSDVIEAYKNKVVVIEAKLDGDFATFKNRLISKATGDYLFQIDADEIPKPTLIKRVKRVLYKKRKEYECFLVPRINIVNGLTPDYVEKWNWVLDEKNRVNFPDYQFRIFKLNGNIKWQYKVHEVLYGYEKCYHLRTKNDDFCLLHIKSIEKQSKQNEFYDTIQN